MLPLRGRRRTHRLPRMVVGHGPVALGFGEDNSMLRTCNARMRNTFAGRLLGWAEPAAHGASRPISMRMPWGGCPETVRSLRPRLPTRPSTLVAAGTAARSGWARPPSPSPSPHRLVPTMPPELPNALLQSRSLLLVTHPLRGREIPRHLP